CLRISAFEVALHPATHLQCDLAPGQPPHLTFGCRAQRVEGGGAPLPRPKVGPVQLSNQLGHLIGRGGRDGPGLSQQRYTAGRRRSACGGAPARLARNAGGALPAARRSARSQSKIVPSSPPDANVRLSGAMASDHTAPCGAAIRRISLPENTSSTRIVQPPPG